MDELIANEVFWEVAKYPVFVLLIIYIAFSVIVVKQVRLMIDTLEVGFEKPLLLIAYIHLFLSILVFLFSVIVL